MLSIHLPNEQAILIHQAFEILAIFVGMQIYRIQTLSAQKESMLSPRRFPIVMGAIIGAALGNKIIFWIYHAEQIVQLFNQPFLFLSGGQSIVGGLIGGLIGVEIAKKIIRSNESTGDAFIVPLLIAIMIGRVGCFLAGLNDETYGIETQLPWGVDFGDGLARHPTPLYEIIFLSLLFYALHTYKFWLSQKSGLSFKLMLSSYLVWRFLIDFIKPAPFTYFNLLSGIQLVCLITLLVYLPLTIKHAKASRSSD